MKSTSLKKRAENVISAEIEGTINDLMAEIDSLEENNERLEDELDAALETIKVLNEEMSQMEDESNAV